jgi:enoyl-CoA hydratase/carnithine racemase
MSLGFRRKEENMNPEFIDNPGFRYHRDTDFKAPVAADESIVKPRKWDDYKDRHKPTFQLSRTDDGVVTAKWWTCGEDNYYGTGMHRGWGQLLQDLNQDPDNELLIIGPYGDNYLSRIMPKMIDERPNMPWWSYEHMYYDGTTYMEELVNLRILTIGVIVGTAFHSELALMCDITLMAEDAVICDPHF